MKRRRVYLRLLFEPRDLWVGVYWYRPASWSLRVYVCLVPMFPLRVEVVES